MKGSGLFIALCLSAGMAFAQLPGTAVKYPGPDSSPADILYFPLNAAKVKTNAAPIIKIVYSRPQKKGREIFGVMEKYATVWRVGANESTSIQFTRNVNIGGKKIKPGTYSLFAIPNENQWTIIVNKQTDRWGAFTYNELMDVVRVNVPVQKTSDVVEYLSMTFAPATTGADLFIAWDRTQVQVPISFEYK